MSRLELNVRKILTRASVDASPSAKGFQLDVSLCCEAGITVLFGASGAGKTLTLDCVAGFHKPDQGRILLDDKILFDAASGLSLPPQRRGVGYVFQNYALFPHMTVGQNLSFGIQHLPPVERGRRIHEQLTRFGIADKAAQHARELSGGEKQRASIARALITQPNILLLDEPVRGLDFPLRAEFYDVLRQVRDEHRIPILLVTHDADEAYLLADQIAVIEHGGIVQCDSAEVIFRQPVSASVARLLGITNVFQGEIEALDPMAGTTRVRAGALLLTLPYLPGRLRGDAVDFCVRSELARVHARDAAPSGAANLLPAHLHAEQLSPTAARLSFEIGEDQRDSKGAKLERLAHFEVTVSRQMYEAQKMKERRPWLVEIPPDAAHVFPKRTPTSN
jgi:molybdate transport system ATP-binding protein